MARIKRYYIILCVVFLQLFLFTQIYFITRNRREMRKNKNRAEIIFEPFDENENLHSPFVPETKHYTPEEPKRTPTTTINNEQEQQYLLSQQQQQEEYDDDEKKEVETSSGSPPNTNVHIFYYAWYANLKTSGKYLHWNHQVLPHWTKQVNDRYPNIGVNFNPDEGDIGASYYPQRGPYDSKDVNLIQDHFKTLKKIGVYVVVLSFWGKEGTDENGEFFGDLLDTYYEVAERIGMKICIHLEPYEGRNAQSILLDLQYLNERYGSSPAFYTVDGKEYLKHSTDPPSQVPLIYVYDSYKSSIEEWNKILSPTGSKTIRNTKYDSVFISLYLNPSKSERLVNSGHFDGFYTYFASNGFTYGSTPKNWDQMKVFSQNRDLIFIPSVGPGYDDLRIRPWNTGNTKSRENGEYYKRYFEKAISLKVPFVSITSFNEWHEGTQIEESIPMKNKKGDYTYRDFSPNQPTFYLDITKKYVEKFIINDD